MNYQNESSNLLGKRCHAQASAQRQEEDDLASNKTQSRVFMQSASSIHSQVNELYDHAHYISSTVHQMNNERSSANKKSRSAPQSPRKK